MSMDPRRGGYLLVRIYAFFVVVGAVLVLLWLAAPSLLATPNIASVWVAIAGFTLLVVAMLLLVQSSKD